MRLHRRFNPVDSFRAKILLLALAACIVMGFAARSILLRNIEVQAADQYKWKMYTNARFQYSICYPPDLLVPQGEPENADGQKFLAKDGAKLIVFGRHNALNEPLKDALDDTAARLSGTSGKVTYKVLKPDWFVVSGETGQSVFYAKTLYAQEQFKSFELTYDRGKSVVYKPVIARLAACFVNTGR